MTTAIVRKSITDLTRRRARAAFTILTLALAVASVGIFAVPPLMERAMDGEVEANRLPDVTVSMPPLRLDDADLEALRGLPNVAEVEPRDVFPTRILVGERRDEALIVGVPDFARQRVDVVAVDSGAAPGRGAVLTDRNNGSDNRFDAEAGGTARVLGGDGSLRELPVSGVGRNLTGADRVAGGAVVLYASAATVARLRGEPGVTRLGFRLDDPSRPAARRTVAAVRDQLRASTAFTAFDDLPVIREPGTYPGKDDFEQIASLLSVFTFLALLSALVLLSSTMTTLVGEQTGEIAAMKAIGARRRDIRRLYLRTSLLFGAIGGLLGAVLGVVLANLLVGAFASMFFGIDAGFAVSLPVLAACLLLGLAGPPLAAAPAVRRASRLPVREALESSGAPLGSPGRLDALLRRARHLPRTAQIGLRGLARRKRRSLATVGQIAIAVGILVGLLSLGTAVGETTRAWFADNRYDVWIASPGNAALPPDASTVVGGVDGVASVQEWLRNDIRVDGRDAQAWGLPADPLIRTRITEGRWYTAREEASGAPVAVLGPTLARRLGAGAGDELRLETAGGPLAVEIVGVSDNQASRSAEAGHNGSVAFVPLTTLRTAIGAEGAVNGLWVRTASRDHAHIDRTTTAIEDALAARGEQVATIVNHELQESQEEANTSLTTIITFLGLIIVAISMVGLAGAVTMSVLERTREIGMLRSIGARARDVRRIFATEGLVIALVGWLAGIPLGYVVARALGWAAGEAVGADFLFVFPLTHVLLALAGTLVVALLVMLAPLRRAVGLRPGDALRHA